MHRIIALVAALLPLQAEAKNPVPEGGYMLVDPILSSGVELGMIVPIYIHMTSLDDTLSFTFITSFTPDKHICETTQKCSRSVEALTLTVTEEDGRIAVNDSAVDTSERIDRVETDAAYVIAPTQIFVDGSAVDVAGKDAAMPGTITLTKPSGRSARLIPATLAFTESTIDFAMQYDLALSSFDHCVVRQVAEFNALRERTPAQEDILRVARTAGRIGKLNAGMDFMEPPAPKGSDKWLHESILTMLRLSLVMGEEGDNPDPKKRIRAVIEGTPLPKAFGEDFEKIYDGAVTGHEEDLLAARAYHRAIQKAMERLDTKQMRDTLCESVILNDQ